MTVFGNPSTLVTICFYFLLPPLPSHHRRLKRWISKIFELNCTKPNKISSRHTCILFLSASAFSPSGSTLIGFLVTGWKYAYNMLTSKHILNFVALPNSGSSRYIQMNYAVSPDQYDVECTWWIKQEAYCVGKLVSLNWVVYFGLLSVKPPQRRRPCSFSRDHCDITPFSSANEQQKR